MKKKVLAGYNICCIGDDRNYSICPRETQKLYQIYPLNMLDGKSKI